MQVLLIRHGQSTNNKEAETRSNESGRQPDPSLTELGHLQAAALASWMVRTDLVPTRIYSSLMKRAIQTAAPLADAFGMDVEVRDNLFEAGGPFIGLYQDQTPHSGTPRSELAAIAPNLRFPEASTEHGWWREPVENASRAVRRAQTVADWLWQQADLPDRVAVVAHAAFLSMVVTALVNPTETQAAIARAEGGAEDFPVWYHFDNTSTTALTLSQTSAHRSVTVQWINRIDHLVDLATHEPTRSSHPFPPAVTPR